jgi:hypothetical protein
MSSNEHWIIGSALFGLSLVLGAAATAMEFHKNSAFAQSSTVHPLPTFLDGARVPSLHDTWKSGEGKPSQEKSSQESKSQPSIAAPSKERGGEEPQAPSAANEVKKTTVAIDRPAATVRQRAEALSARFGGGEAAPASVEAPASEITTSALPDKSVPSSMPVQGDQAGAAAPEQPAEKTKVPAVTGVRSEPPSQLVKRVAIPPNPVRSPRRAQDRKPLWPPKSRVGAVPRTDRDGSSSARPPAVKREIPPVTIPSELRSLGWDVQVERH